jgi:hypothetical protein
VLQLSNPLTGLTPGDTGDMDTAMFAAARSGDDGEIRLEGTDEEESDARGFLDRCTWRQNMDTWM